MEKEQADRKTTKNPTSSSSLLGRAAGVPAPGEQWETAALPGPRGPFREHVWSLALVTKGTPGQQEDRLHTKVYLTKQESTYHSRGAGLGINRL